jgi:twinkle protein|tara:strand:+ start:181 stop:1113 length:933 start_codon:yes stop_codon:yes gene_type:complete
MAKYRVTSKQEVTDYCKGIYSNGYTKGLTTGIAPLDQHYTFRKGELTIMTGFANIGKTTTQLFLMIMASKLYGYRWLMYCPENEPVGDLMIDIAEMYCGNTADKDYGARMNQSEYLQAIEWAYNHFTVLTFDETPTVEDVLEAFEDYMQVEAFDGVSLDPLNDLKAAEKQSKYEYYYEALSNIRRFIKRHKVMFYLVVHPGTAANRRRNDDGSRPAPNMSDVEFGAMFGNRADNFIVFHRNPQSENWNMTEIHIQKIKFQKLVGVPTPETRPIALFYHYATRRFRYLNENGSPIDPIAMIDSKVKPSNIF